MTRNTYYKMYPNDFNEAVRVMDDAEKGFYFRCVMYSFQNGGPPDDLETLRKAIPGKRTKADFMKRYKKIFPGGHVGVKLGGRI